MDILKQLNWRYATKSFDSEKIIPENDISTIVNAFNLTATSYGLQPIKLMVISDKLVQEDLVEHSMYQKQIGQASHVLVFCVDTKINDQTIIEYFELVKKVRDTPDDILNPFKKFLIEDFKAKSEKEIFEWASKQAYLAMGNLLTVCAMLNIDACPMEGFVPEQYDELLNLKKLNLKSVLVMPIGYRAKDDLMSSLQKVRKPLEDVIIYK
ncbi:Oxygen-insensitive NAD(P)H nitroreductase / Dihydropteridine reductase [Mesoflavibacter sp. HG96]|uniref:NAD(P)H-dependent oxidoreductase n=1 Tax=Mesoflavibacter TaxID=444051 RepID=UPI000D106BD4|nr:MULTISPECIES: NAD(P)H-dependent oxidoreductase [Mesoflavibacter]QIJ90475.1 Oxygen-insensitive NAD(P)H nitroreductase / Dihydropteridine reductase [Mesoflavibacter sp. HG96]QIJ93203.1 Oxygen-insensitive NAD(P)H nitroreductase / Dihydropteridine reductase [Mesoflavibacter sp. HG37]